MNKPDWKDAPEWANWLACDYDGVWVWYEKKPIKTESMWFPEEGECLCTGSINRNWEESLEPRPKG